MSTGWISQARAALILCLVVSGAWSQGHPEMPPAAIQERAGANVYDLAAAFAAAGWPAGFEILEEDQPTDRLPPVIVGTAQVALSEVLASITHRSPGMWRQPWVASWSCDQDRAARSTCGARRPRANGKSGAS